MPDNFVLVPMQVDVMVVNQDAQVSTPFNRTPTQYQNLQQFADPDPPFPPASSTPPATGIYIHWTLPDAIRHGTYDEQGTTTFPFAPNRWLIVRIWAGASEADTLKAWILQSDFLAEPSTQANFIDPTALNNDGLPVLKLLGQALPFDSSLTSLPSQPNPFLQAIGPGTITFANFSPNVQNVFAFTDPVEDSTNKPISTGTFTYYVAGWYSDADIDPLNNTTWQPSNEIPGAYNNDKFEWYVYASSNELPTSTLVHGMVSSVVWDLNADNPPAQNYPTDIQSSVKVAIGNTAVDALSALVQLYTPDQSEAVAQADVLEAFQYGLLNQFDQPGSSEALNIAIRRHWYGASSGGTLWQITQTERTDNTALPAPPPATITPQQATLLATLNMEQAELDRQQRILESMQWNLHGLWWKYNWLQNSVDPLPISDPNGTITSWLVTQLATHIGSGANQKSPVSCNNQSGTDPSEEVWYYCQVQAQQNALNAATTAVSTTQTQLTALLDGTQMLKATSLPQYFSPNDPVLLVTGLGRATNFDPQGSLLCRLPSQTVNALTINGTTYSSDGSNGTNIASDIPALDDPNNLLPDGIQQLHAECFMLSPNLFAQDVPDGPTSEAVETAIEALPPGPAQGHFPPLAFTTSVDGKPTWKWQQPWVPLLLDWTVAVVEAPAYTNTPGQPAYTFNQSNWIFDGTDFNWNDPTSLTGVSETTQMQLSGRTFITPSLIFNLADQLEKYVQNQQARHPSVEALLEDLDQYLEGIKNQDILSQRLSGLMAQMVQRSPIQTVVPTGPVANLLTDDIQGIPMPYPDEVNLPVGDYAPMGGTFFVIQSLTVTDTFGRTIDLIQANENGAPPGTQDANLEGYFYPITGWNMKSPTGVAPPPPPPSGSPPTPPGDAAKRMVQLPPRMVQDSQLSFRLISNDGQNSDIYQVAGSNPICGWIVPNHLDRSLALYAPDGSAWGELYLSMVAPNQYLPVWQPDPTNPQAPQTIADIPNTYVQNMLQALSERTDEGLGFYDFLQVIDATLWTINPQGKRKDQDLSVLIGRPLAIVRAQLTLKLRGLPFYNQDWWNTFNVDFTKPLPPVTQAAPLSTVDGGVLTPLWPVRLGSAALRDDGLIGYYADNSDGTGFQVFNTVNDLADAQTNYLNQIGANNNYIQLCFIHDNTGTPDPAQNQVCNITMLLDPRASVHAFTGLLPVTELQVPSSFVTPALQTMYYTFRAGPLLTLSDAVRIPRPKASQGTWSWYDNVLNSVIPLSQSDQNVRISITPPLIKEGWLKFTPNPAQNPDED